MGEVESYLCCLVQAQDILGLFLHNVQQPSQNIGHLQEKAAFAIQMLLG